MNQQSMDVEKSMSEIYALMENRGQYFAEYGGSLEEINVHDTLGVGGVALRKPGLVDHRRGHSYASQALPVPLGGLGEQSRSAVGGTLRRDWS